VARQFFVYIMASGRNGTLYVGVTSNLVQRVWQHKEGCGRGVHPSVWGQDTRLFRSSRNRRECHCPRKADEEMEKSLEGKLIEERNPEWRDLYSKIIV
jgi:putative endonuclease